ncbi:MAG: aldehyde dehydrogenase family protein, partial [Oceanisphaera sp.]|nr:aldehyde dehydrogenase family protein [Oceanisphaera sp.]
MSVSVFRNYIAGEWVEGSSSIANISPSDLSDVIGHYAQADAAQTKAAIAAAVNGQLEWQKSGLEQRYAVLMAIGDELIARKDELGRILAREEGK